MTSTSSLLLLAASHHDLFTLRELLKTTSPTVTDPTTNRSALHLVIDSISSESSPEEQKDVENCLRELLLNGAIWNDLDSNGETPGCIAWRKGLGGAYEVMVEAGVRAEILLGRMGGGWEELAGEEDGEQEDEAEAETADADVASEDVRKAVIKSPDTDDTVGVIASPDTDVTPTISSETPVRKTIDVTPEVYLNSKLTYDSTKLLDEDGNGVMMSWEKGIMERSVKELLSDDPKAAFEARVLNIGFGLGLLDSAFQRRLEGRGRHVIVEPHPSVLQHMRSTGWFDKPGVEILEGKWQDVIVDLIADGTEFDAIYYDTFAEGYEDLKTFFMEGVVSMLAPKGKGRFGFFHGLGADRKISYDVMTRVVEMDLEEAGMEVRWVEIPIDIEEGVKKDQEKERWNGVKRKYWDVGNIYKLPVCEFLG
jgi:protein arginine N-methyltransferase 2